MGRRKAWALAWLLAVTLSALLLQAPSARGDELLANGGFEVNLGSEWAVTSGDTLDRVDTPSLVHNGSYAGRLACHGPDHCAIQQLVDSVGYAQQYELKAYVVWKDSDLLGLSVGVLWLDEQGSEAGYVDAVTACAVEGDEPYRCLTTGAQVSPARARFAKVKVIVFPATESGATVYLDDFSFSGPAAPSPTPSPTPPATETPPPTASPSPSPGPIASPTPSPVASPSPTAVPTATEAPSTATPSPPTPMPSAGLANAGFEEADGGGRPLAWRKYGGELRRSAVAKQEGRFAAAFTSRTTSTKWAFQTVAVEGGEAYVLSGYALKNDANVQGAYLRLSWYAIPDGSGRAIDSVDSTTRLTDDSPGFRFLTTGPVLAPSEAASAKVRLMLDPLSEAEGKVYFDDISFEETIMPPPTQTAVPSPPSAVTQTPLSPPSDAGQGLALSTVTPTPLAGEFQPPSSPTALNSPPTVLGDSGATTSGRDGFSQSDADPEGTPSRTPVFLYRERRTAQSVQAGEGVAAGSDEGDGLSPVLLVLATAVPAATAAAAAFFVWRRWQKRARPP
jgi:hypothetical protein